MEEEPPLRERERNDDDGLLLHLLDMRIRTIMQLKHTQERKKCLQGNKGA